ncbi:MAG TPA: hypothetical protein PK765_03330 [bacterium]|nr:hypothetical protein [bacterium]
MPRPRTPLSSTERSLRAIELHTRESRDEVGKLSMLAEEIRQHELMKQGRSRMRAFLYQIMLGIAFAVGTVFGLVLLSWVTLHYFQDSQMLRDIIERQLDIRNFNIERFREEAKEGSGFGRIPDLF